MRRGDVHWYSFAPPDKRRPVVILTRQPALSFLTAITVAPLTARLRPTRSYVRVSRADGLREESAVNLDGIQTIPSDQLGPFIASLPPARVRQIEAAIAYALGLDRDV